VSGGLRVDTNVSSKAISALGLTMAGESGCSAAAIEIPALSQDNRVLGRARATVGARMAQRYDTISEPLAQFIAEQHVFFVATAARDGRVNVSPKGLDSLRVHGPNRVVWLSGSGSGNETAGHLLDLNRMTLMFCSFGRQPLILRLYGTAREIQPGDSGWDELIALFAPMPGARQIFDMAVEMVQTSCGYGVPLMQFEGDRPLLAQWAQNKGPDGLAAYRQEHNRTTIDGAPTGLRP
jgi:hypothetical protein